MTYAVVFSLPWNVVQHCGGEHRPEWPGDGVIAGTTKVSGALSPCRVFLHMADGTLLGFRRTGQDGAYMFKGLPPGDYRLVIEDDRKGARRSVVEHTVVP